MGSREPATHTWRSQIETTSKSAHAARRIPLLWPLRLIAFVTYTVRRGTRYAYYICTGCKNALSLARRHDSWRRSLDASLLRELEPILGRQPGEIAIHQSLERVTSDPATRQVSVSLRDAAGSFIPYLPNPNDDRKQAEFRQSAAPWRSRSVIRSWHAKESCAAMRSWQAGAPTRSRLSQILLLTNLAPAIQEELLFLPKVVSGPERITEEQLRSIAKVIDWDEQIALFRSLWDSSGPTSGRNLAVSANGLLA